MVDVIRRTFLIGIGAVALTRDRIESYISDSVARGELSTEQGKSLVEEMTQRAEQERDRVENFVRQQVERAFETAGVPSRADVAMLQTRVETLERRVRDLTFSGGASGASEASADHVPGSPPITIDPSVADPIPSSSEPELPEAPGGSDRKSKK